MEQHDERDEAGDAGRIDRRKALGLGAAAAGAAWVAPAILSADAAAAASGGPNPPTPCCTGTAVELIAVCQPENSNVPNVCTPFAQTSVSVCRPFTSSVMLLARDSAGVNAPYFDELGVVRVTSPTNVVRVANYYNWELDCADPAGPNVPLPSSGPCETPGPTPAINISSLFGTECGTFTVDFEVRNANPPVAWSTAWIVPT